MRKHQTKHFFVMGILALRGTLCVCVWSWVSLKGRNEENEVRPQRMTIGMCFFFQLCALSLSLSFFLFQRKLVCSKTLKKASSTMATGQFSDNVEKKKGEKEQRRRSCTSVDGIKENFCSQTLSPCSIIKVTRRVGVEVHPKRHHWNFFGLSIWLTQYAFGFERILSGVDRGVREMVVGEEQVGRGGLILEKKWQMMSKCHCDWYLLR